ncbi:hypothetical protein FKM82_030669 [Ascaphus truei]
MVQELSQIVHRCPHPLPRLKLSCMLTMAQCRMLEEIITGAGEVTIEEGVGEPKGITSADQALVLTVGNRDTGDRNVGPLLRVTTNNKIISSRIIKVREITGSIKAMVSRTNHSTSRIAAETCSKILRGHNKITIIRAKMFPALNIMLHGTKRCLIANRAARGRKPSSAHKLLCLMDG